MICPSCGSHNTHTLRGARRFRTRTSGRSRFRWYVCGDCRRHFPTMEFPVVSERDAEAAEVLG